MNISKLLGNRVLIQLDPTPTHSPGGLLIPEILRQKPALGTVLALGKDRKGAGCGMLAEVAVGDRVRLDTTMGGVDLLHAGHPCRIVSILDIQAVLGPNDSVVMNVPGFSVFSASSAASC